MNQTYTVLLGVVAIVVVMLMFMAIWASRFVKVAPNQVLVVSGRKAQLPDGRIVGYRIVKGGGTFVFPVVERADVLSLEVINVEMPRVKARTVGGHAVQADCVAQVKINGDDASIAEAMEHFLSKSPAEIGNVMRPILEKHLGSVLAGSKLETAFEDPAACAALVQTAAAADLQAMGLSIISFTMRDIRAA